MLKQNYTPYLVIGNETEGNYVLRKSQYGKTEEEMLQLAKRIILAKTRNQLALLKAVREKDEKMLAGIGKIREDIGKIPDCVGYENLLGYEGNVSKLFFASYFAEIGWQRREPRTKRDIQNLLLDIGYTYLFHFVEAMVRLYGFDSYYGFYHRSWYQRKSLPLDLMEPFRCIIDKALVKAYHLRQVDARDFGFRNGQYELPWKSAKKYTSIFLAAIMENKKEIYTYVKEFYRFFMREDAQFPTFEIAP